MEHPGTKVEHCPEHWNIGGGTLPVTFVSDFRLSCLIIDLKEMFHLNVPPNVPGKPLANRVFCLLWDIGTFIYY